jgi:hypothetical protein
MVMTAVVAVVAAPELYFVAVDTKRMEQQQ